jgi:hypothetical protein
VRFACWYSNSFGDSPYSDVMNIYISNDSGNNWVLAESIGPLERASGGWYEYTFWASQFVTPTNRMRLRFEVSDWGTGSVVEAGVDDVSVTAYRCGAGNPPSVLTTTLPSAYMGSSYSVQLDADGGFGRLAWLDALASLDGTGLTLSPSGLLSGTPVYVLPLSFVARVTDALGVSDEQSLEVDVLAPFDCGDANGDGGVSVADAVHLINFVFKGGPAPDPIEAGDANCDDQTNVGDAVYLINYVFKSGPAPCCP